MTVIDGGSKGLWLSSARSDDETDDVRISLTPTRPSVVWANIVALMPAADPSLAEAFSG